MAPSWFSLETVAGLAAGLAFAFLCQVNMRAAILVFVALGAITAIQVGAFSGQEVTQGLLPVEVLATVLIGAWLLGRNRESALRPATFQTPLLLLIPCSFVSLAAGMLWFDPTIPLGHVNVAVSVGQILLFVWPIGIYLVIANSVRDDRMLRAIRNVIVVMAVPSLVLLLAPVAWRPRLEWTIAFALPASSICFAESFETRSVARRAFLFLMTFSPALYGFFSDKAFYYVYVLVSCTVIASLRTPRLVLGLAPFAFAAYVVVVPVATGSPIPGVLRSAVDTEVRQQSLGGAGGREQLLMDGLGIWVRHPLFGVGPGNNYPYMLRYSTLGTPHNQYINLLLELGIVGLVCFLVFAVRAALTGLRLWRTMHQRHRPLVLVWLGVFGGMLVGGMFGDFMLPSIRNSGLELLSYYYIQWVLLGVLTSIAALERSRQTASDLAWRH